MAQSGQGMAGKEEVDPDTDPPTVKAQGITFPVLVHELIKGVMEVLATQGLPDDPRQAQMVMDSEDTLTAEIWDLRLGPVIWEKFREAYPHDLMQDDKREVQNYLFSEFARMDAKEMFRLTKDVLSDSDRGRDELKRIVGDIIKEMGQSDYEETYPDDVSEPEVPESPTTTTSDVELDMDGVLDKIFTQGMDALTPQEVKFLKSQSK